MRFFYCLFLFVPCLLAEALSGGKPLPKFEHFYLREIIPGSLIVEDVFEDDPRFRLNLVSSKTFAQNFNQIEFFRSNSYPMGFTEASLGRNKYYDSLARSHQVIFVLLIGCLWDPLMAETAKMMNDLASVYSHKELNDLSLINQCRLWFGKKVKTGVKRDQLEAILRTKDKPSMMLLEANFRGARFFWPSNIFGIISDLYQLMFFIPYRPDLAFALIQTAGQEADALELLKNNNLQFPILDDVQGEISERYIEDRVPRMMVMNHRSEIIYNGRVMDFLGLKDQIDRLLLPMYAAIGEAAVEANHQKRVAMVQARKEAELRKLREMQKKTGGRRGPKMGKSRASGTGEENTEKVQLEDLGRRK